jgi:hypothetical protein
MPVTAPTIAIVHIPRRVLRQDTAMIFRPVSMGAALFLVGLPWRSAESQLLMPPKIFVAPLSVRNGQPVVGTPQRVVDEPSTSNGEPSFTPDGRSLLFTAGGSQSGPGLIRAVYRYDLVSKTTTRLTPTADLLEPPKLESNPAEIPSQSR